MDTEQTILLTNRKSSLNNKTEKPKRTHLRRKVTMPCHLILAPDHRYVAGEVLDVSIGGMQIRTEENLEIDQKMLLSFNGPSGFSWLHVQGEVKRIIHGRRQGDKGRSYGVEFESVDSIGKTILTGRLRNLPPPTPERPVV